MKLIKLNNTGLYIIVDDYNTKEAYDSRITKGTVFYKDELKDICIAEYSPASKVSRPVIASTNEYSNLGIKNSYGIPLIDINEINNHLKHYTGEDSEEVSLNKLVSILEKADVRKHTCINGMGYSQLERDIVKELKGDIEKKFTLADIKKAFSSARYIFESDLTPHFKDCDEYIKSIQEEKKEWSVEIEMDVVPDFESRSRDNDGQICNGLKKLIPSLNNGYITITKINQ